MPKWVTIRRKEFNRLREAATAFPDKKTVEDILLVQDAEAFRRIKAYEGRWNLHQDIIDAEKWRKEAPNLIADAELGALVRQMPVGAHLIKLMALDAPAYTWQCGIELPASGWHTPEEAIRSAMKEAAE